MFWAPRAWQEAVQILLNFGAKTSNVLKANDNKTNIDDKTNIDEFLDNHSEEGTSSYHL